MEKKPSNNGRFNGRLSEASAIINGRNNSLLVGNKLF